MPVEHEAQLTECERILEYTFSDRELLERCLTHASVARTRIESNERLEFFGDAVLGMSVCEELFHRFPDEPEGELTRLKSELVSRTTCAKIARDLGLDDVLIVGRGLRTRGELPTSVHAAVLESLIAGVYVDGGFEAAHDLVRRLFFPEIDKALAEPNRNYKSDLQQFAQKEIRATPGYRLIDEKGPDHSKCFCMAAVIASTTYPSAWGASKKEAEQLAASNALNQIEAERMADD